MRDPFTDERIEEIKAWFQTACCQHGSVCNAYEFDEILKDIAELKAQNSQALGILHALIGISGSGAPDPSVYLMAGWVDA